MGYSYPVMFPNGRMAALAPFIFTWAIIADFDEIGYKNRWCFDSLAMAYGALCDWVDKGGEGEPEGWHRHLEYGKPIRRRHADGSIYKEVD